MNKGFFFSRRAIIAGAGISVIGVDAAAAEACAARERFIVYKDKSGKYRWRLCSGNGRQIAEHSQPYETKAACQRGLMTVQKYHTAPILDEDDCGSECSKSSR